MLNFHFFSACCCDKGDGGTAKRATQKQTWCPVPHLLTVHHRLGSRSQMRRQDRRVREVARPPRIAHSNGECLSSPPAGLVEALQSTGLSTRVTKGGPGPAFGTLDRTTERSTPKQSAVEAYPTKCTAIGIGAALFIATRGAALFSSAHTPPSHTERTASHRAPPPSPRSGTATPHPRRSGTGLSLREA